MKKSSSPDDPLNVLNATRLNQANSGSVREFGSRKVAAGSSTLHDAIDVDASCQDEQPIHYRDAPSAERVSDKDLAIPLASVSSMSAAVMVGRTADAPREPLSRTCPTCKQPIPNTSTHEETDRKHAGSSPESLPSIPLLPSINENAVPPSAPQTSQLKVDTSVSEKASSQVPSPHTVGEGNAKARARGWSMVDEDAEKAQRELTWKRYREMAQNLPALDGSVEEGDQKTNPVEILKDTLFKVLEEAEQLSNKHYSLQHNEKELEMNLKIARSNLQLAEMNSEMLEEALRRGGEGFAGRMAPLPTQNSSNKTSIDTTRTENSRPPTPSMAAPGRMSSDTATKSMGGYRSTSMTMPFSGGGSAAAAMIPPTIVRRRSSEGGPSAGSNAQKTSSGPSAVIPAAGRPSMERANTVGAGAMPPPSISAGSGIGSFFRKNIDKRSSGLMKDLGLQNLKIPDMSNLQNLPIPSPSAGARAEFFSSLGMSNAGASSSSPNLANGNGPSPISRSPLQSRPYRGGWYDAAADMGGASDVEIQKLRASLVATNRSVTTLKDELGAMKKAKAELEAELETLSQALFEEANKMVADERKKRAEKEDEAREAIEEREALRKLVKLMEAEKAGRSATQPDAVTDSSEQDSSTLRSESDASAVSEDTRQVPGGFPSSADSAVWLDANAPLATAPRPLQASAETLDDLMKRMEADFGKL
ncbi:hypothetical protein NliqN6_5620 [Naganishia liquefaciens]|uniref:GDP/GTP exchange factor Sec2 N-terminal domain-containing protein n=1 Tax=Naganishia liquefaciens TaxID=104408 RepID=A0A8H3TY51_9TREE|nr:hypothetical protein NliqN6_5620 [Naganishia liquefaciens]